MERRDFIRNLLGVAAATAMPSEIWPFRKIFVPLTPRIIITQVMATELEIFAKNIPDLVYAEMPIYRYVKRHADLINLQLDAFRVTNG